MIISFLWFIQKQGDLQMLTIKYQSCKIKIGFNFILCILVLNCFLLKLEINLVFWKFWKNKQTLQGHYSKLANCLISCKVILKSGGQYLSILPSHMLCTIIFWKSHLWPAVGLGQCRMRFPRRMRWSTIRTLSRW